MKLPFSLVRVQELLFNQIRISFESSEIKIQYEEIVSTNNIDDAFKSAKQLPGRTKAIVAVGGGKAIDYCKYIAFVSQPPLISVPTIISNDGFCSPLSSLIVNEKHKDSHPIRSYCGHGNY